MPFPIHTDPVPLQFDASGTMRVAGTRVTLELLLEHYRAGAAPEALAERFPALSLADVYATLAYCHRHPEEVDHYLAEQTAATSQALESVADYLRPWSEVRDHLQKRTSQGS